MATPDRGELPTLMEPLLLSSDSRHRPELSDLAFDLTQKSARLSSSLPAPLLPPLAQLVRAMNCYYSNLIEGHNTHPVDIERALRNEYSADRYQRDLQLEAKAHIAVQLLLDQGGLGGTAATSAEGLQQIHRRFYELLPDDLQWVDDPSTGERVRVLAGELRHRDVRVGDHVAISPGALPRFIIRYAEVYGRLGRAETVLASAAAHHRLLWIHPFLDGNGRVARLVAHAMLSEVLQTAGIWSVARGLARNAQRYKSLLANCDQPRRNALDGRGSLSEEALAAFTRFFLEISLDQVSFMESLMEPGKLRTRILVWAQEEMERGELPVNSDRILSAILYRGELPRGEADAVLGTGDRQARRIVSALIAKGVLTSNGSRAPLRLTFPATLAGRWMPGLFPEQTA